MAQSKPTEMEVLLQALRQLTCNVASLKQTKEASASKPKKKGACWKCGGEGHFKRDCTTADTENE